MNGLFVYDDQVSNPPNSVTVTASGTRSGYATAAAADEDPNYVWKPDSYGGTEWLRFDFGTPVVSPDAWALCFHTLADAAATATLKVGTLDNGSTWDITVDSIACSGKPGYQPHVLGTFDTPPGWKQYWRVEITGATQLYAIGRVILGTKLELTETPDAPFVDRGVHFAQRTETDGGEERREVAAPPIKLTLLQWQAISSSTFLEALKTLEETQGTIYPCLFVDHRTADSDPYGARLLRLQGLRVDEGKPGDIYRARLGVKDDVIQWTA